mgnify:FL=1
MHAYGLVDMQTITRSEAGELEIQCGTGGYVDEEAEACSSDGMKALWREAHTAVNDGLLDGTLATFASSFIKKRFSEKR